MQRGIEGFDRGLASTGTTIRSYNTGDGYFQKRDWDGVRIYEASAEPNK